MRDRRRWPAARRAPGSVRRRASARPTQNAASAAAARWRRASPRRALAAVGPGRRGLRGRLRSWRRRLGAGCLVREPLRLRGRGPLRAALDAADDPRVFGPTMPSAASPRSVCKRPHCRVGQRAEAPVDSRPAEAVAAAAQHALHAPDRGARLAAHSGALGEHRRCASLAARAGAGARRSSGPRPRPAPAAPSGFVSGRRKATSLIVIATPFETSHRDAGPTRGTAWCTHRAAPQRRRDGCAERPRRG